MVNQAISKLINLAKTLAIFAGLSAVLLTSCQGSQNKADSAQSDAVDKVLGSSDTKDSATRDLNPGDEGQAIPDQKDLQAVPDPKGLSQ